MTALLLKDLLCLKHQAKFLLLFFVMYIFLFITMNIDFLYGMLIILSTTLVMNTFAYDETAKWENYALALPITKQHLVMSKYLLSVLLSCGGVLMCVIISIIKNQTKLENWLAIYSFFGVAIFVISFLLPILYKFGTQKGRLLLIGIILMPTFGALALKQLGLPMPSDSIIKLLITLSPFVLAACFIGSYFISCKIVENKEI
jgi:ABC-type transport system involved in multi-copper enzyme maturation permease subunit